MFYAAFLKQPSEILADGECYRVIQTDIMVMANDFAAKCKSIILCPPLMHIQKPAKLITDIFSTMATTESKGSMLGPYY